MSEEDPDLRLVRDLGSDDPDRRREALGALYDRHQRRVFSTAYRVLGDRARAEDVTHEVFLLIRERIGSFRGDAGFASWLYRITVNRAIDARRREARRPAWRMGDALGDVVGTRPRGEGGGPSPVEATVRGAGREEVRRALARLSPKLRAILVLRYLEGLSYDELAEVLDCSMGTIKSRLSRAHAALARALGERGEGGAP